MTSPTTWCMWYTLNCHCRRGACGEGEGWRGGGEGWEGEEGVEVKLNKGESGLENRKWEDRLERG